MKQEQDPNPTKIPIKEVYGQLLAILTNRRREKDSNLIIGYEIEELATVLNKTVEETTTLLTEMNEFLLGLGLSISSFQQDQKEWVAVKSLYAAPIELHEDELTVLGTLIMMMEEKKESKVETQKIIDYLSKREYFNDYKVKKLLKELVTTGYIKKAQSGGVTYGPRTLIEINDEARRFIAQQASELLF